MTKSEMLTEIERVLGFVQLGTGSTSDRLGEILKELGNYQELIHHHRHHHNQQEIAERQMAALKREIVCAVCGEPADGPFYCYEHKG